MIESPNYLAQAPDHAAKDALSEVLEAVRLKGGKMVQLALSSPGTHMVDGGHRSFLLVEVGPLIVELESGDVIRLTKGDVLVLPTGCSFCVRADADDETAGHVQWLWATYELDPRLAGRLVQILPQRMVMRAVDSKAFVSLALAAQFAIEEITTPKPGAAVMIARIVELILIRLLRLWASDAKLGPSWLAGAMDGQLAPVLAAMHANPQHKWRVPQLARASGMSRSAFADRFSRIVGQPPSRYLIGLRLDKAAEMLMAKNNRVSDVAAGVGYESEASFSRAFKHRFGSAPSEWKNR